MEVAFANMYGNPWAQWSFTMELNGMALHNGNITKKSNNMALGTVALGLKYTPDVYPIPIKHPAEPVKQVVAMEGCLQGGVNQLDREDASRYYPNLSFNLGFYLPITNAYRIGVGGDVFYNSIYDGKQRSDQIRYNFIKDDQLQNKIRAGLFLANDLTIDRFTAGVHTGLYLFSKIQVPRYDERGNPNGNRTENFLYTKLVTKYKINDYFLLTAQCKSHLLKIEYFEFGCGFVIPGISLFFPNPFRNISFKKEKGPNEELRID